MAEAKDEEALPHEHNDGASADDTQHEGARTSEQAEREDVGSDSRTSCGSDDASAEVVPGEDGDVEEAELTPEFQEAVLQIVSSAIHARRSSSWSGMLPPADEFYKFEPEDRAHMIGWNDAGTVDESRRQDRLADAAIKQNARGMTYLMVMVLVSFALAMVCFWVLHSVPAGIAFLSAQLLVAFVNVLPDITSSIGRKSTEKE